MRYLNIQTLRQTTEFIDDATTIIDTDARVSNWFTKCPDGFKGEWIGDIYTFIEIPPPTQVELDQLVKDNRIAEIYARLDKIDILSIRSLRSKSNGRGNADDDTKLTELDDEAIALRAERDILTA